MKTSSAFSISQPTWPAMLAGLFLLSLAAAALAGEGVKPCADDVARLCKDVQPGQGRVAKCLKEHKDELSPACKEHIAMARKKVKGAKDACKEDAQKLCKDTQPGGGRIVQCLKQHESELSHACREKMESPRSRK